MSLFTACQNTPSRPEAILDANYEPTVPTTSTAITSESGTTAEPPQNAAGVWHYTCTTGCSGGTGSASPCATCGQTLVHNTQYHDTQGASNTSNVTSNDGGISMANPLAGAMTPPATTTTKTPEPPQNADGVWHYICDAGCAGGAGSATACSSCGKTLAHNTAYH